MNLGRDSTSQLAEAMPDAQPLRFWSRAQPFLAANSRPYLVATLSVLVCLGIRLALDPYLTDKLPFAFFLLPVVIASWAGGLGPSVFAASMGVPVVLWFFVEPRHNLRLRHPSDAIALLLYLLTASIVCWFGAKMRRDKTVLADTLSMADHQREGLLLEIAERQRVEQELIRSELRYRMLTEAMPQLVWTASADGACDYLSRQWAEYTGLSAETHLGDGWVKVLHPDDRKMVLETWQRATRTGTKPDCEFRLLSRDGAYHWFKSRAVAMRDDSGNVIKWFGTFTDISEIVQARESQSKKQEELEALVKSRTAEIEKLKNQAEEENCYLKEKVRHRNGHHRIIGQSRPIREVLAHAEQVAPTDSTVLILGETGTGKELLAAHIHDLSPRSSRALVSVNCAAMPAPLVESELFGREKGAFTGSLSRQIGRFELAAGSTIFLDEVGELPPEIQSKLLRAIEARQIERLGNPKPIPINVRIIAATNRDLQQAVNEGRFRQDLYYRLNVFPVVVPPLRERRGDIPLLVWAFVDEFARTFNKNIQGVERESMDALQHYSWPGNVRELRNVIERAMIAASGPKLRIQLPAAVALSAPTTTRKLEEVERQHVLSMLEEVGWRIRGANGAAEKLGLKPTTLEARMAKLGIRRPNRVEGL